MVARRSVPHVCPERQVHAPLHLLTDWVPIDLRKNIAVADSTALKGTPVFMLPGHNNPVLLLGRLQFNKGFPESISQLLQFRVLRRAHLLQLLHDGKNYGSESPSLAGKNDATPRSRPPLPTP